MTIGVIGVGVVGGAVLTAFSSVFDVIAYDIKGKYNDEGNWDKIINDTEVVFICVPTPTINGKQDRTALESVITRLKTDSYKGVVVIKCTVLPGTTDKLRDQTGLRIVHNPEFLTAATPYEDFMRQPNVLLGGKFEDATVVSRFYSSLLPTVQSIIRTSVETEVVKYMRNIFLAVKVAYANEVYSLCESVGCSYDSVLETMLSQGGIEKGHWRVPGPDGQRGFGGMCFPKDIAAIHSFMVERGLVSSVIEGAIETNARVREGN